MHWLANVLSIVNFSLNKFYCIDFYGSFTLTVHVENNSMITQSETTYSSISKVKQICQTNLKYSVIGTILNIHHISAMNNIPLRLYHHMVGNNSGHRILCTKYEETLNMYIFSWISGQLWDLRALLIDYGSSIFDLYPVLNWVKAQAWVKTHPYWAKFQYPPSIF